MNNDTIKDKSKIEEILNEIVNLKKYSNNLLDNTKGEKLEDYINVLAKNINNLNNNVERIYDKNFVEIETLQD